MQIHEKYKDKFDFSVRNFPTKVLRSKRRISPCIFQVVASLPTEVLLLLALPTLAQTVQDSYSDAI